MNYILNTNLNKEKMKNKKEFGKIKQKLYKNYMNMIYHIQQEFVQIMILEYHIGTI